MSEKLREGSIIIKDKLSFEIFRLWVEMKNLFKPTKPSGLLF